MKKHASEELSQLKQMVRTREETRAEADVLFGETASRMRKQDREKLEKLFVQTPAAITMAPNLQKVSYVPELNTERSAKAGRIGGGIGGGALGAALGHAFKGGAGAAIGGALGTAGGALAGHHIGKARAKFSRDQYLSDAREQMKLLDALKVERGMQKSSSVSPHVDAFFEKLSQPQWDDAQTRYPELQKVAYANPTTKSPDLKKRSSDQGNGPVVRQSDLSGGSA